MNELDCGCSRDDKGERVLLCEYHVHFARHERCRSCGTRIVFCNHTDVDAHMPHCPAGSRKSMEFWFTSRDVEREHEELENQDFVVGIEDDPSFGR